jgi:hypothetical protein
MKGSFRKVRLTIPEGPSQQVKKWKRDMSMIVRPIVIITSMSKEVSQMLH